MIKPKLKQFLQSLTSSELEEKSKKYVPPHTAHQNRWAISPFKNWLTSRNEGQIYFPEDMLESNHPLSMIQKCLSAFVFEGTVSKNGQPMSPVSITAIIAAIYRHAGASGTYLSKYLRQKGSLKQSPNKKKTHYGRLVYLEATILRAC